LIFVTRRLVRDVDVFGNVTVRQGSNLYGFSEEVRKCSHTTGKPLPKAFPQARVYAVGGNYKTESFNKRELPFWLNQVGFQGKQDAKFGSGHEQWRERARAVLKSLDHAIRKRD
jgi:hypothetical protein